MAHETRNRARREARLPHEFLARFKGAAELQGRSLSDFVVTAANEAACKAIEQAEIIRLSATDQRRIAEAILHPPQPAKALEKATRTRRELMQAYVARPCWPTPLSEWSMGMSPRTCSSSMP